MQFLGLLGMYFDAVVVEVEMCYFFSDWLWPYCDKSIKVLNSCFGFLEKNKKKYII